MDVAHATQSHRARVAIFPLRHGFVAEARMTLFEIALTVAPYAFGLVLTSAAAVLSLLPGRRV